MTAKPIPEGYHSVTPYLVIRGAARLIEFMKDAFDATEHYRMPRPDGTIMHAEVRIGDSNLMMGEPTDPTKQMPATLYLYVNDTDAVYQKALAAGATSITAPADQFYGDRNAGIQDPAGNLWWIATHKEDVTNEEVQRRAEALAGK